RLICFGKAAQIYLVKVRKTTNGFEIFFWRDIEIVRGFISYHDRYFYSTFHCTFYFPVN
ncbi:hypothetical protein D049_5278B, partial [Vibrio parahaemolyticus VPTS-2010]